METDRLILKFLMKKIGINKIQDKFEGEKLEVVTGFLFLGSKITADGDCRHEIKRCLLLGRKAMTDLDSI